MKSNTLRLLAQCVWPCVLSQRPKRVSNHTDLVKEPFSFLQYQPALSTTSVPCTMHPGFNGCVEPDVGQGGSSASCTKQRGTVFYS